MLCLLSTCGSLILIVSIFSQILQIRLDTQAEVILVLAIVIIVVAMQAPGRNEVVVLEEEIMHLQSDQTAQIGCIAFESS